MRFTPFQRLAIGTTATTYLLILVGGLVRASGAGLGCPDWPRCFGSWIPPASAANLPPGFDPSQFNAALMWTEYLNRLLGVTVGLLILATTISAWRHHRRDPRILWTTVAALLLTGFQGWLGGRVVAHELAAWIVTVHLIVAIIIVQLLLYATFEAFAPRAPTTGDPRVTWGVALLILITLTQAGFGIQVREGVDAALDGGIGRSEALATVGRMDVLHRDLAFVVLIGATLLTFWLLTRRSSLIRWSFVTLGLAAAQILVGVSMAYVALIPAAQVGHLSLASLLLGAETVLWLLSRRQSV